MGFLRRTRPEPRPLHEAEAYERCHGHRSGDLIRVVRVAPPRKRLAGDLTGELLRRAFETRLDARSASPDA